MISLTRAIRRAYWLGGALAVLCASPVHSQDAEISITPTSTPLPVLNVPFNLQIDFDLGLAPTSASLFYRATGSGDDYRVLTADQALDPETYTLSVPGTLFEPAGIDFYLEYVLGGEIQTFPTIEENGVSQFQLPVVSLAQEAPTVLRPRQYQMVTVPFQFAARDLRLAINGVANTFVPNFLLPSATDDPEDVLEDLGVYNEETWRVLRWNPLTETYLDGPSDVEPFQPGNAYWVASANGGGFGVSSVLPAGFDIPPLGEFERLVFQSQPVEVLLQPGWNQIGSPYLFPVRWDEVEGSALVDAPVASVLGEYEPEQSVLAPWAGYFVLNENPGPVTLSFRVPDGLLGDGDSLEQPPLADRLLRKAGADAFLLQIQTDEITSGDEPLQTRNTFAGVGQEAFRIALPPPVSDGLHVRLRDGDGRTLATAIDAESDGSAWTLDLRAPASWSEMRRFDVRLDEHGEWPAGWSYRLTDAATGEPVALGDGAFSVLLGPDRTARQFRLTLGPDAALGVDAPAPGAPLFGRVGPNPVQSGRGVEVSYRTPGGPGEIVVLDLLGRPVHRLTAASEAGWHDAAWDGRTASGSVAPGVYLLHLRTPEGQAVRKLTVLR